MVSFLLVPTKGKTSIKNDMMEWKKWIKERSWYFWFVLILVIIAIIILLMDIGDHEMGDLSILDDEHIEDCDEVCNVNMEVSYIKPESNKKIKWKREEMCRDIFQGIYDQKFESCRPDFLKNPRTGRKLELDGYNEDLKIAFEHNGKHHYNFPNTFHKTKQDFLDQIYRDKYKRGECDRIGIYLISIPYHIHQDDLREYIISKLPRED